MGKKRIIKKGGDSSVTGTALTRVPKKKVASGVLNVLATFNNTMLTLCDTKGNSLITVSSGALGFKGSRKSTPFAAAKVGEMIGDKAAQMGMKDASVVIRGIGAGRESALRGFSSKGIAITKIADQTPVPHNGPRLPKPRRI
ncbi:MAG TPA: 30S ribosomal protein S11 [Candidatus Paceibacterota bacterium]|nr:30S ribosomal protein S11 [Candidatus Paceibacterota bacterium]